MKRNSLLLIPVFLCLVFSMCERENEIVFTHDGAYCWFQDPRAVYVQGEYERTYAQWMTADGTLQIGAYNHQTDEIQIETLKTDWDADDHNTGSFLVLPDNRLMVFYAQHNKRGLFCRITQNPEDISVWEDEVIVSNTDRITYSHPVYLASEELFYVFWRGPSWKPTFATSADGITWSEPQILIQESGREHQSIRPYIKIVTDGKSAIHFAFTDGHPRNEASNSLYYLKYQAGGFFRADGEEAGRISALPVNHGKSDLVYDGSTLGRAWVWDIALDDGGNPVIAYTRLPEETDHRYCYARWQGKEWLDTEVVPGGGWFPQTPDNVVEREPHYSGGMALDQSNPSILYLSRPGELSFEIERWTTPDEGKTWKERQLTAESEQLNVRPVFPRGQSEDASHILCMTGGYIHYENYQTGIKILKWK